jgi:hypothetical protein
MCALTYAAIDLQDIERGLPPEHIRCRYYFSGICERDEVATSTEDFLQHLKVYVVQHAHPASAVFCNREVDVQHLECFLRERFYIATGREMPKRSKQQRAMSLLIQHADWDDEQFRVALGTTSKAMQRWGSFHYVRREITRLRRTNATSL